MLLRVGDTPLLALDLLDFSTKLFVLPAEVDVSHEDHRLDCQENNQVNGEDNLIRTEVHADKGYELLYDGQQRLYEPTLGSLLLPTSCRLAFPG